jgi:hypothetical protein
MEILLKNNKINETPEERFKRVAEARTNMVLEKLRVLGNLSNKQIYSYSEKDIKKIFSVINKQLREIRVKFYSGKRKKFKF